MSLRMTRGCAAGTKTIQLFVCVCGGGGGGGGLLKFEQVIIIIIILLLFYKTLNVQNTRKVAEFT